MFPEILFIGLNKLLHVNLLIWIFSTLSQLNLNNAFLFILLKIRSEVKISIFILNTVIKSKWNSFLWFLHRHKLHYTSEWSNTTAICNHNQWFFGNCESRFETIDSQLLWKRFQISAGQTILDCWNTQVKVFLVIFPWTQSVGPWQVKSQISIKLKTWFKVLQNILANKVINFIFPN